MSVIPVSSVVEVSVVGIPEPGTAAGRFELPYPDAGGVEALYVPAIPAAAGAAAMLLPVWGIALMRGSMNATRAASWLSFVMLRVVD